MDEVMDNFEAKFCKWRTIWYWKNTGRVNSLLFMDDTTLITESERLAKICKRDYWSV